MHIARWGLGMGAAARTVLAGLMLTGGVARAQSASEHAGPPAKMTVIASGDCRDPDLISNLRLLSKELQQRVKTQFIDEQTFRTRLAPRATKSVDELNRQTDAAQMLYYQAIYPKAEEQTREVLTEVERLPPSPDRVQLAVRAGILYGVIQRGLGHPDDGDDAFRRVIRLSPKYQMDPDLFSPSTRGRFDKVRKELFAQKRARLEVTSVPAGAEVYLDGVAAGRTPYSANVVPGNYQVMVGKEDVWSLPHPLDVVRQGSLHVDLQFEGAIHPDRVPCINSRGDERSRLAAASKLGTLVEADDVVVLRLERQTSGPSWLAATVTNVGSGKIREGGLKVRDPSQPPEGLAELANFIVTGKAGKQVLTVEAGLPPGSSPTAAAQRGLADRAGGLQRTAPSDSFPFAAAPVAEAQKGEPSSTTFRTPLGLGIGGVGVLAAGAAVVFELQATSAWNRFNEAYASGAPVPETDGYRAAVTDKHTAEIDQTVAVVSGALGLAGIASGATLILLDRGSHAGTHVSARLVPGPGSVGVVGTFGP